MSKHTPGPWKQQSYLLYASQMGKAEYPIHAKKRGLIAKAYKDSDACLIAAAPDLLEALQTFPGFTDDATIGDTWIETMRAAVAKATGKTK